MTTGFTLIEDPRRPYAMPVDKILPVAFTERISETDFGPRVQSANRILISIIKGRSIFTIAIPPDHLTMINRLDAFLYLSFIEEKKEKVKTPSISPIVISSTTNNPRFEVVGKDDDAAGGGGSGWRWVGIV
ncbi:hypothetical protein V1478_014894 [Vespula squamosa]|uniref:Uncharacterized protein n=1 Tax=Vespula squamosa TaxID=30214 RepID=A0ABD2A3L3_VESSQ